MLVLDLERADRIALAELGPEVLRLALAVVRDDRVRRLEDRVRRAVVLLERDRLRLAEVALELEDVPDVGAAERVDRLVRVAHRADVAVLLREQLEQAVLGVVRVLVLVDEDVAERLLPFLQRLREALQHLDGEHQEVVEVDRVRAEQAALVEVVGLRDGLVVERRDALGVLGGRDELVLRGRDLRVDAARDEALRVALELLQAGLRQPHLVGLVVDREVRAVAEPRGLPAQDPPAGGVEGQDPDRARDRAEQVLEPLAHLSRGLVRERDREDLVRLHADGVEQVRDAVGEDARLPGARACDHEQRALGGEDRLALRRVQVGEIALWRGNGHPADASGRVARGSALERVCVDRGQCSSTTSRLFPSRSRKKNILGTGSSPPIGSSTSTPRWRNVAWAASRSSVVSTMHVCSFPGSRPG